MAATIDTGKYRVGWYGQHNFEIIADGRKVAVIYSPVIWETGENRHDCAAGMRQAYQIAAFLAQEDVK